MTDVGQCRRSDYICVINYSRNPSKQAAGLVKSGILVTCARDNYQNEAANVAHAHRVSSGASLPSGYKASA